MNTTHRSHRLLRHPLLWAPVGASLILLSTGVLVGALGEGGEVQRAAGSLLAAGAAVVLYLLTMRLLAARPVPELRGRVLVDVLLGLAIGSGFVLLSALTVAALGGYELAWQPTAALSTVLVAVAVNLGAAVAEELVFRGLLLQAFERLWGPWVAVGATAVLFGLAHLLNPGATLWSSVAIAVEAGVLCGVAFLWRRSIWLVVALHFAWNLLESLLGIPVSGHRDPGLWVTTVHGPDALTGGDFGLEASVVPVVVSVILSVLLLLAMRRRRVATA